MSLRNRPDDLCDNAWQIVQAVYKNTTENETGYFDDLNQFDFSTEELVQLCNDLHEKRYLFCHNPGTDAMYLYILDKTFYACRP